VVDICAAGLCEVPYRFYIRLKKMRKSTFLVGKSAVLGGIGNLGTAAGGGREGKKRRDQLENDP
jgi:hypothetical protein